MDCSEVRNRLVAFQDRELSPGETTQVDEHLQSCTPCNDHHESLVAVTPEPFLNVPEYDERWAALDAAVAAELDHPAPRPRVLRPWHERTTAYLAEEWQVSTGALFVYAAALTLVAMWGASNWKYAQDLEVALHAPPHTNITVVEASSPDVIPAADYRPVSYKPTGDNAPLTEDPNGQ